MKTINATAQVLAAGMLAMLTVSAFADPPAHAPAHGWRKKQQTSYVGLSGRQWAYDFEISAGRCNREEIATVVGGVVGGVIASRVAEENRTVATILGAAAGALIGNRIGDRLDDRDRRCVGHALELGAAGRPVAWTNETTGAQYELTPGAETVRNGDVCRSFTMVATAGRERSRESGLACQSEDGVWQFER